MVRKPRRKTATTMRSSAAAPAVRAATTATGASPASIASLPSAGVVPSSTADAAASPAPRRPSKTQHLWYWAGVLVLSPHLPQEHRDDVRCGAGVQGIRSIRTPSPGRFLFTDHRSPPERRP